MKNPSRTRIEQEVTVTFNNAEDHALVWTCSPAHLRKFGRLGYEMVRNDGEGRMFKVPKRAISFRSPIATVSNLNPEQRKAASERMKQFQAAKVEKP